LLVLAVAVVAWLCLNKETPQKSPAPEPLNAIVMPQPSQHETNEAEIISNAVPVQAVQQPTNTIESTAPLTNALMATNIEQWKAIIKGLHKMPGLSESWDMEQTNLTTSIPITLQQNGKTVSYKAQFIDISIKNGNGDILEAQLHSPIMSIDETRELGLQLCNMLGQDPSGFLAWCDKVGNHWLDAPLYGTGNRFYSFQTIGGYSNEKPWVINFMIIPNP